MNRVEAGRLLASYFDGELSPDERRQVMNAILSDQELYNAFAEELILREMLENPEFHAKVDAVVNPGVRGAWHITDSFRALTSVWRVAGVAVAVALVLLSVVVLHRAGRGGKDIVARSGVPHATVESEQPKTTRSPAPMHAPAEQPTVKREPPTRTGVPTVLTLFLMPGERGAGAGNTLVLLPGIRKIRLLIDLDEDSYGAYWALVESPDIGFKQEFHDLRPHPGLDGNRRIVIEIPSSALRPGDYTVSILALNADGGRESAGGYTFSVVRRK